MTIQTATGDPEPRPLELMLAQFDANLGASRRLSLPRWLTYAGLMALLALSVWASLAQVDRVVRTQGRVVPSGKPQLVQHLEGGIVSQVQVREGDVVAPGDELIVVSDLLANATRGEKRERLSGLLAKIARLQAEASGAARYQVPEGADSASAEVRHEAEAFAARQSRLSQQTMVLRQQVAQKKQERIEQESRHQGLQAEEAVARQQLALVTTMVNRGAGSQQELLEAQARVQRLETQLRETGSALPRLSAAVLELQARAGEVEAQFRSESQTELSSASVELRRLQEDLKGDDDRVRRTVVTAPVAGTINKLYANTVGGVVRSGETLLELTPQDGDLLVETRASPADRGAMTMGQDAVLRVAAFDYTSYGTLKARVVEISADSLADERGERYFRVVMRVDPASLKAFGQRVSPGMTLSADVITGERTVLQYLLSPIRGLASTAFREHQ